jgi:hypothetical protein
MKSGHRRIFVLIFYFYVSTSIPHSKTLENGRRQNCKPYSYIVGPFPLISNTFSCNALVDNSTIACADPGARNPIGMSRNFI